MRLNSTKFLLLLTVIVGAMIPQFSFAAEGGVAGGGGGNSILCNDGKYYSYDFILTQKTQGRMNQAFRNMRDPIEMLRAIQRTMAFKIPAMANSLNDFISSLQSSEFDVSPLGGGRIWIPGLNPLAPLGDESRLRVPSMCLDNRGEPKIYQTVIRFENESHVVQYNFDERQVLALRQNGALQVSFLYIHEWLRDYIQDAMVIMNIDRMLHEEGWITATPEGVLSALRRYGMNTNDLVPYGGLRAVADPLAPLPASPGTPRQL